MLKGRPPLAAPPLVIGVFGALCLPGLWPLRRTLVGRTCTSTCSKEKNKKQSGTDGPGTRSVRHRTPTNVPADGLELEPVLVDLAHELVFVALCWVPGSRVPLA